MHTSQKLTSIIVSLSEPNIRDTFDKPIADYYMNMNAKCGFKIDAGKAGGFKLIVIFDITSINPLKLSYDNKCNSVNLDN